jgi:hypothetical protein
MHGASALHSSLNAASSSLESFSSENRFVPSDATIAALTAEMENLIIDKQLQSHPILRGYWDAAIARRRQESDQHVQGTLPQRLPSPPQSLSPVDHPKEFASYDGEQGQSMNEKLRSIPSTRELPSPRPSPPRDVVGPSSGYIRGRSLSY